MNSEGLIFLTADDFASATETEGLSFGFSAVLTVVFSLTCLEESLAATFAVSFTGSFAVSLTDSFTDLFLVSLEAVFI